MARNLSSTLEIDYVALEGDTMSRPLAFRAKSYPSSGFSSTILPEAGSNQPKPSNQNH